MFKFKENETSLKIEFTAGLTTFFTMVYVLAVQPLVLANAGMPKEALFTATALSTIMATTIMALWSKLPFAVAPGMGINAFFVVVVVSMGYTWPQALTAILVSGTIFFLFSLSPLRQRLLDEVPPPLKFAVCAGVGLMIASIGLFNSNVLIPSPRGNLILADFSQAKPLLVLLGTAITAALLALKFRYALLAGIFLSTLIGIPLGVTDISALKGGNIFSLPPDMSAIFFKFDFSILSSMDFWVSVVFAFLFIEIVISLAGFLGLLSILGVKGERYQPLLGNAFKADSLSVALGACLGMSPNTVYAESGTGILTGGRTGATGLVVAGLFAITLFFAPIFMIIPFAAIAPALLVVGWLMMSSLRFIDFDKPSESLPAILLVIFSGLSWQITEGLGIAWLAYILMKILNGEFKDINPTVLVVGCFFLIKFIFI